MMMPDDDDRYLSDDEVTKLTQISSTTRWRMRQQGTFPALVELSPGKRMNTLGQIRKWKAARLAEAERKAERLAKEQASRRKRGRPRKAAEPHLNG